VLGAHTPFFPQLKYKRRFVFGNPLLHFLPSSRAILVFHAYDLVKNLIDFSLVLVGDFYTCPLKDLSKMSKIAGQSTHLSK
jgi:hypothetical protein